MLKEHNDEDCLSAFPVLVPYRGCLCKTMFATALTMCIESACILLAYTRTCQKTLQLAYQMINRRICCIPSPPFKTVQAINNGNIAIGYYCTEYF